MDNPELEAELARIAAQKPKGNVESQPEAEPQPEKDKELVVSIEELIPGINTDGLKTLEEIRQGAPIDKDMEYKGSNFPTEYQAHFFEEMRYLSPTMDVGRLLFQDQIVVELGAGKESGAQKVSVMFGAKGHVGVELHHAQELLKHLEGNQKASKELREEHPEQHEYSDVPISVAAEDMLTFLRRLPDHSVSIYMSGIDAAILDDPTYRNAVAKEIERVLSPNGGCISNHTFMDYEYDRKGTQLKCVSDGSRNDPDGKGMWKTSYLTARELTEYAPTKEEVKEVIKSVYKQLGTTVFTVNDLGLIKEFRMWKNIEEIRVRNSQNPITERTKLLLDTIDLLRELEPDLMMYGVPELQGADSRFRNSNHKDEAEEKKLAERIETTYRWSRDEKRYEELDARLDARIGMSRHVSLTDLVFNKDLAQLGEMAKHIEAPPKFYLNFLNREFYKDKDKSDKIKEEVKTALRTFFYR